MARRPAPPESFVPVGVIVGAFGVRGALKVDPQTDFLERFEPGETVWLKGIERKITWFGWHKTQVRIQLEGIDSPDAGDVLRGETLYVPAEDRPELEDDEFYVGDLLGLTVETTTGRVLGKVEGLIQGPGQDLLKVGEILIPMVHAFVKEIDVEGGRIRVELLPGMIPGEDEE